jgi:hypothetical protein
MIVTADQLVAHAIGDYIIQSDWMATEKTKKSIAALAHAVTYTAVFLFFTTSWLALAVIGVTHFAIDRWRLARFVCFAKNLPWPGSERDWSKCSKTGYPDSSPGWLTVWLLIIADNVMHVCINGAALKWLV